MNQRDERLIRAERHSVTFLCPGFGAIPAGGAKVIYEYANGLADRGWMVRVVHPCTLSTRELEYVRASFRRRARRWLGYQRRRLTGSFRPDRWFKVRDNVELLCTKSLQPAHLPKSDAWIATYWETAPWTALNPGARLYLIQHLETWAGPHDEVMSTWRLPLRKVVISHWLEDVAKGLGETSDYIPNGLDFQKYGMDVPPEQRDPKSVAMVCYMASDWKGSAQGLEALRQVKEKFPDLKAQLFGNLPRPPELPAWIDYFENPPQSEIRNLYNRAAIYISPSWAEGWALCPAEAQQCGAALAITKIGGHEYAIDGQTALLSPPKDANALAANIVRLIEDQPLRLRLARDGNQHIQQFTWDAAVTKFEAVLMDALKQTERASAANPSTVRAAVAS